MSRLIDADALIMALRLEYPMMPMFKENQKEWEIKTDGYRKAEEVIRNAPTIDAVEVVRGEWIDKPTKGVRYICSRCTGRFDYQWKYCPNCGARMKGADDDNND